MSKAREYVQRGEEFYRKAAEEILAAQKANPTLSNREIGERFGHSEHWVRKVVRFGTTPTARSGLGPFAENDWEDRKDAAAKKILREDTPEQIAEMLDTPEVQEKVAEAIVMKAPTAVAKAAARSESERVERNQREQRDRAPEMVSRYGYADTITETFKAKRAYALALEKARTVEVGRGSKRRP